jgi:UDP-N-acetylmuramate dehydrogenase
MAYPEMTKEALDILAAEYGEKLHRDVPLSRYTAARIGGPADALLSVEDAAELADAASRLWELHLPFVVLGGGSNILVSDSGVRGVVLLNHARQMRFDSAGDPPSVWAESGTNFGLIARKAAGLGLSGMEWAVGIPGSLGGAVVGNAGAHGGDTAGNLFVATILQLPEMSLLGSHPVQEEWSADQFDYDYRSSILKNSRRGVVLSARLHLGKSTPQAVQAVVDRYTEQRRRTQPPGASMGSMFKNPPGDYAGSLIDACGLKGTRQGDAEISGLHANFFINQGNATAKDVLTLMRIAQQAVKERFGIRLEPEIEFIGDWTADEKSF